MKTKFLFVVALVTMAAMLSAMVTPAAAAGGEKSITLFSANYNPGKGVVFLFEVKGDFASFDGSGMIAGGGDFKLNCVLKDDGNLACIGDKGLSQYIGSTATVTVNGFSGDAVIRGAHYCYSLWDYSASTGNAWHDFGPYCQNKPAQQWDWVSHWLPDSSHPDGGYWNDVQFYEVTNPCAPPGPGYFNFWCPH